MNDDKEHVDEEAELIKREDVLDKFMEGFFSDETSAHLAKAIMTAVQEAAILEAAARRKQQE